MQFPVEKMGQEGHDYNSPPSFALNLSKDEEELLREQNFTGFMNGKWKVD